MREWEKSNKESLLKKFKNLTFYDYDIKITFTIFNINLEYHLGKNKGWALISMTPADDHQEDKAFLGDIAIELVTEKSQIEGIEIIYNVDDRNSRED